MNESLRHGADDHQEAPRGLTGTVLRGSGFAAGGYALAQALNLLAYIILARLLVPAEFGVYTAATALLGLALLVTESGMTSAVVQRRDRLEEAAATAVIATTVAGVVFGLVSLATAPLLGLFFDDSEIAVVAAAMSGYILLRTASSVPDALLQRRFSFLRRLVIEPIQVIVFATTAIFCAAEGLGVWSLVIGQYAGVLIDLVLSWVLARYKPQLRLASIAMWRELVAFGRHIFVATAILNVAQQADSLIVGRAFGVARLGQFRYGYRLASTPFQALLAAAAYVLFPAFSRISHIQERFLPAFKRSLRWTTLLAFPTGLIMVPLGVPIAEIVFGDVWREAGKAAAAMGLYTGGMMISSVLSEALKAQGRPDLLTRMHSVTAISTIGLMVAAIPLGFVAVAASVSAGALIGAAYGVVAGGTVLGVAGREMLAEIWPPAIAGVAMVAALFPLEIALDAAAHPLVASLALLLLEGIAAMLVYAVSLIVVSFRFREELRWAALGLSRKLRRA